MPLEVIPDVTERPMAVYKHMYEADAPARHPVHRVHMVPLVLGTIFVVAALATGLRMIEQSIEGVAGPSPAVTTDSRAPSPLLHPESRFIIFDHIASLFRTEAAHAATAPYAGTLMITSHKRLEMAPGTKEIYRAGFKNVGAKTWANTGKGYLSVYTWDPKYRKSEFRDVSWVRPEQPAKMKDKSVLPGAVGYFEFPLRAPTKPGAYKETFAVAAEDTAWVQGGIFTVEIAVKGKTAVKKDTGASAKKSSHQALLLLTSAKQLTLKGGESAVFEAGFKNAGKIAWRARAITTADVAVAEEAGAKSLFHDPSWETGTRPVSLAAGEVPPGTIDFIKFTVRAPLRRGEYKAAFHLVVDGERAEGGELEIPITVTDDAAIAEILQPITQLPFLASEPRIRIGLYKPEGPVQLEGNVEYAIKTATGEALGMLLPGQRATVNYFPSSGTYDVLTPAGEFVVTQPVRFEPSDPVAGIITLTNYERPVSYNKKLNDNRYRDTIEIRYAEKNKAVWVVNELATEPYLKGLAETSTSSHMEYKKALAVAARAYGYYHYLLGEKHADRGFTLDSVYDQVYRGVGAETRVPDFGRAVDETRGQVVTYNGEVVVTPYFGHSDGRTRAWEEVWRGGAKPWIKSVEATFDRAQGYPTLLGHGVGMSQWDANERAKSGVPHDQILKYYYTGVAVQKAWQ